MACKGISWGTPLGAEFWAIHRDDSGKGTWSLTLRNLEVWEPVPRLITYL